MAHLTDARYKAVGQTVLYVPEEDLSRPMEDMAKDKELVERLEGGHGTLDTLDTLDTGQWWTQDTLDTRLIYCLSVLTVKAADVQRV